MLINEQFLNDPRIKKAKEEVLQALSDHQKNISGIKPADPSKEIDYNQALDRLSEIRGGKLFYPYLGSGFGKGALVELADGSIKYDMITGIGPHVYGHSYPDIVGSSFDAALSDTLMQGHLQQNEDTLKLLDLIKKESKMAHVFLTSSGAMANENALKLAFQKNYPASRILAFERCFAGRSITVSQITDKPQFREGLPINTFVDYLPFYEGKESIEKAVNVLKSHLNRYPKQHAVFIIEPVQGEGGFYPAPAHFLNPLIDMARTQKIAIFMDEVQTFGRTNSLFAFHELGLLEKTDLSAIGKMSQVCATLFTEEYKPRPGLLSQTFTASTSQIKGSLLLLNKLISGDYYGSNGKINYFHNLFVKGFEEISKKDPELLEGPYGIGGMIAFTPYKRNPEKNKQFIQQLFINGVIAFIAGSDSSRVRMLIPFLAITEEDISQVLKIIEETLIQCK